MSKYIESEVLELKEKYTPNICKEIVSFLNTEGGTVIIGVKDNGEVIGVDKIDETLKKLSDVITTQIEPNPQDEVRTELVFNEGKILIVIHIQKGIKNIYCQKKYGYSSNGCTIRIGTTNKEMTPQQIHIRYEKNYTDSEYMLIKNAQHAALSFRELKIYYEEKGFHVEPHSFEANFNLRNRSGEYNLLAELLADNNDIPFIFVKFGGTDKTRISKRNDYGCGCILTTYEKIKNRLSAENICISDTKARPRKDTFLFDFDCVNEAVINALVHNDWTITEPQISMFSDRIEILSHGGLTSGMTKKDFFSGISKPRNTTLMRIFLNMGLCEHTDHGVPTIVKRYSEEVFDIEDNYIKCTIPFDKTVLEKNLKTQAGLNTGLDIRLNKSEKDVVEYLIDNANETAVSLSEKIDISKRTVERTFKSLQDKGIIVRDGSKRDGYWKVIK